MITCRRWRCPTCGFFGRRAARRARIWADRVHISWAAKLARESRTRRAGPDGLLSVTECRVLPPDLATYERWDRILREDMRAAIEASWEKAVNADMAPTPPTCTRCPEWVIEHPIGYCAHAQLESYGTADVVAEVIGELSYEEQSTMIGDPIADTIIEETP